MEQVMSVKKLLMVGIGLALVAACAPPETAQRTAPVPLPPIKQACAGREGWGDPAPPARVFGNVYMVGTCGIVSLLITTPDGYFLIDGAVKEAAPGIADNIRKLGFDPKDVRYLLSSHEHVDHAGGLAYLKRITGAKFITRAAARTALESGVPHPTDPQLGLLPPFGGVEAELLIGDGDTIRIGKQALTMIATPGHTPGGTSWTWTSCDSATCHQVVYADSLGAVSADAYRFSDHPEYVAVLKATIKRVAAIKPCDILIAPHPSQSNFFERLANEMPLVDNMGCANYAKAAAERLAAKLAKEAGK
jgi:metallo-beta-lactamase class B